jgi:hypothetical protein
MRVEKSSRLIQRKNVLNVPWRFALRNDQLAVFNPIAHRNDATHPHAFALRGSGFVAGVFPRGKIALKLGEGEQDKLASSLE